LKALTFSSFGGPGVLEYIEVPQPELKPDEILVKTEAIGLNFADIYRRRGNYHLKGKPPYIAGYEGAGVVVNANGHAGFTMHTRIGFADVAYANAEFVAVPLAHAIPLPDAISTETAAAVLLQGLTAQYLASDSHNIKPHEVVAIHAASGGVGQILTQIAKYKGAKVIGLTSSKAKEDIIKECGADHVLNLNDDWKQQIIRLTQGKGADVVYDSVGATLADSLEAARTGGIVVFFGMSGGDPALVDPRKLMDESKTLTGGDLWSYLTSGNERQQRVAELFGWISSGVIKLKPAVSFPLSQGRQAHQFLESGKSAGKILLIP
jgi:NADPH:quinone reductase